MPRLSFCIPDEVEEQIKKAAKADGKSVSAFLADFVTTSFKPKTWPENFFLEIAGVWIGDFPKCSRTNPKRLARIQAKK